MKKLYIALGYFFVAVGMIGVFVPLLPTTPFLILAAYFFSRSSPKLYQWLLNLPKIGPAVKDWESNGIIRTKFKALATLMIFILTSYPIYKIPIVGVKIGVIVSILCVLTFIWTRPSK